MYSRRSFSFQRELKGRHGDRDDDEDIQLNILLSYYLRNLKGACCMLFLVWDLFRSVLGFDKSR